jgi:hypothetical protein
MLGISKCMNFKTFLEQQQFIGLVQEQFASPGKPMVQNPNKPWSAKKSQILNYWRNLRGDIPIMITPMKDKGDGHYQSYGEDGVRVSGSWEFISAVLGRLKEILAYENPQTKLRLVFRGMDRAHARPDKQTFVFYVNLEQRQKPMKGI